MLLETTDFKPDAQYNLEPANSDILVDAIDRNSKHAGHDAWRKNHNETKARNSADQYKPTNDSGTSDKEPEKNEAQPKKLALSERLRTALTTHAGLSSEAYNRIWEAANRDSESY